MNRPRVRSLLAGAVAFSSGLALGYIDSRPGFDDTGVTATGLLVAAATAVLIEGTGRVSPTGILALLVGIWTPLLELPASGSLAAALALILAAAGAAVGSVLVRAAPPPVRDVTGHG